MYVELVVDGKLRVAVLEGESVALNGKEIEWQELKGKELCTVKDLLELCTTLEPSAPREGSRS